MEAIQEFEALLETGENREFAVEWIVAKEQIEYRRVIGLIGFPISIGHSYLIQICLKKCIDIFINPRHNYYVP